MLQENILGYYFQLKHEKKTVTIVEGKSIYLY